MPVKYRRGSYETGGGSLPQILAGMEEMFGKNSDAALILKTILFHHSFSPVPDWPNPAELTETEIGAMINRPLWRLLGTLMFVDSDAWQLFDGLATRRQYANGIVEFIMAVGHNLPLESRRLK